MLKMSPHLLRQRQPHGTQVAHLVLGSVEVKGVPTNYDLLKKIITETIRGDSHTTKNPGDGPGYWEKQVREVRYNEGQTPSRTWETDQHIQVMGNQGEIQCPLIKGSDSTDPYEESPLIIDLGDDTDPPSDGGISQPKDIQNPQVTSIQSGHQPTGQDHGNMYQYPPTPCRQIRHSNEVWYPGNIIQAPDNTHDEPPVIEIEYKPLY